MREDKLFQVLKTGEKVSGILVGLELVIYGQVCYKLASINVPKIKISVFVLEIKD